MLAQQIRTKKVKNNQQVSFFYQLLVRTVWAAVLLACFHNPCLAQTQAAFASPAEATDAGTPAASATNCRILYLGFVGALEPAGNKNSGVVQIRKTLQGKDYSDVCANSFSPYTWTDGRDWLLKHFPAHAGPLSPAELEQSPKVILVGHSMGGWAMLSVARELRSRDIPVELTIQMDSVGITDYTIPRNVKCAAIFHANDVLMFMTTKHVRLEDPQHTKMLEDVLVAGANHQSITRDPRIRELVMKTVQDLRTTLASNAGAAEAHPATSPANPADKK
jgi:hypothetical protein